ncbi:Nudix (Nucleoside diphosphate linked moiety X)-type motif 1 [Clonorchis sinensis]|uniref:Nudix (Nucleoside diphosphate linked moiety X)-type motif 1 n=1 Tax=Clonorchis sinensis TaxID=79923 RepID=A0A8T1MIX2_CLOSI|nr:Nudix (Nucleoside diphosphate linked moiety X)-type motif 1 [Clonorchis sinensis]
MSNCLTSRWTYRKLYTLMVVVYNQWDPNHPPQVMKNGQLVSFNHTNSSTRWLLLGLKQRGFGQGRWNGFGGKVHSGDSSPKAAALRELKEESGLDVSDENIEEIGRLWFTFTESDECFEVHVFMCPHWHPFNSTTGQIQWPSDTDEMHPSWFPIGALVDKSDDPSTFSLDISSIPFNNMWPDDRLWLPKALLGTHFAGWLHFTRILQPSKPSRPDLLADCSASTNALHIDPYEVPAYRLEFFSPSDGTKYNGVIEAKENDTPKFSIQSMVQLLNLDSEDELRHWMSSKSRIGPWISELLVFP